MAAIFHEENGRSDCDLSDPDLTELIPCYHHMISGLLIIARKTADVIDDISDPD